MTAPRRIRRAARILLLDEAERLLLFRFAPDGRRAFWCGVGGECDPGEDFAQAAVRELFEETGLQVPHCGPEIARRADDYLTLEGEPITSDERFFRVITTTFTPDTRGHTPLEQAMIRDHRWFTRAELAAWHEPIFPVNILELLDLEVQA
ncbi:NUDIX hydrolase [Novosphingobium cyanobacteriorum]|uniref:NUDIX domain-containing protein n=1 Tax=Novosphingobium cyanobacteriorum TaxID=3024215 RepID=A0ABT6CJV9_9SPHN|nr:NUDIX domain-containing protein [Novosphingobium cyanobacteriorum]MDF8334209.1 NUDIX domain-containing protein [Novosphingobium cyanobacteriorum]